MKKTSSKEVGIFKEFSKCCPISILESSIRKRKPPRPDIFCKTTQSKMLDFELVELIDPNIAKNLSQTVSLKLKLEKLEKKLDSKKKKSFRKKYKGALIAIEFKATIISKEKKKFLPKVFEILEGLSSSFQGDLDQGQLSPHSNILERFSVTRGIWNGVSYQICDATSFSDPVFDPVIKKFSNKYKSPYSINLLIYLDFQPLPICKKYISQLKNVVQPLNKSRKFDSVWVFIRGKGKVKKMSGKI